MAAEVVFTPVRPPIAAESVTSRSATNSALAISVVVVNFRRPDQTAALARQLDASDCLRSGQAEIVIVDN
uniref:hypothetical protein n=1 Tax=Salmonella sp. SAL4435 TaxID=3159890 RepID=UPI00397ADA85